MGVWALFGVIRCEDLNGVIIDGEQVVDGLVLTRD